MCLFKICLGKTHKHADREMGVDVIDLKSIFSHSNH